MGIFSEFSHKKNVIFHSYVSLPEGKPWFIYPGLTLYGYTPFAMG